MKKFDILIIDDEIDITEIIATILKKTIYGVQTANSYEDAMLNLKESVPPLIFCDIAMPGKTGLEFLQDVRRKGYASAVVMLTANAGKPEILQSLRLGAVDVLTKPFEARSLIDFTHNWLEIGKRLQSLSIQDSSTGHLRMLDLFRVQCNEQRKKFRGA